VSNRRGDRRRRVSRYVDVYAETDFPSRVAGRRRIDAAGSARTTSGAPTWWTDKLSTCTDFDRRRTGFHPRAVGRPAVRLQDC